MSVPTGMNLPKLITQFHSEDACRDTLENLRWPDGVQCPRCEFNKVTRVKGRITFDCLNCSYQFSVLSGTVLQDTKLPLWKWFMASYLIVDSKKGISANQLKRMIGVSYKTAWYLTHRIRFAMAQLDQTPLSGVVEVDETYVGGKVRGKGRGYRGNKTMVLGAVSRSGEIRLRVEKRADRKTLHSFIKANVADDAQAIYTDEWPAYVGAGDANTPHESVNHRDDEWVRGQVHTQTVESAWSLFKRGVVGTYHQLSEKHLDAYLDEFEWRHNNRQNPYIFRETLRVLVTADPLTFESLTARE